MNKRHTDKGMSDSQWLLATKRMLGLSARGICVAIGLIFFWIFSAGVAVTIYKTTLERLDERVEVLEAIHERDGQ